MEKLHAKTKMHKPPAVASILCEAPDVSRKNYTGHPFQSSHQITLTPAAIWLQKTQKTLNKKHPAEPIVITYYRINIFNMLILLSASHHETASFRKASDLVCFVCYHVQSTEEQFLAWEIFTEWTNEWMNEWIETQVAFREYVESLPKDCRAERWEEPKF